MLVECQASTQAAGITVVVDRFEVQVSYKAWPESVIDLSVYYNNKMASKTLIKFK